MIRRIALLLGLLVIPLTAQAHSANQQPFVAINGQGATVYPVGYTTLPDFVLPQDLGYTTYTVGQKLHFDLLTNNLPTSPDILPQLTFTWDLGDGSSTTGLSFDHTFSKMGSYIIQLNATGIPDATGPQLLDIILINVVPNASYQLPQAKITVNGTASNNPYTDILKFSFTNPISLSGSPSTGGSSAISSYLWDLGDQEKSTASSLNHTYDIRFSTVAPVLRVTTNDGFISDTLVQIENQSLSAATPAPTAAPTPSHRSPLAVWVTSGIVVVVAIAATIWRSRKPTVE